jgi:hypothetical protein
MRYRGELMSDELARLALARPENYDATLFNDHERQQLLAQITSTQVHRTTCGLGQRTRRPRWTVNVMAITMAAIVAVVISVLLPTNGPGGPGRANAAELEHLAVIAGSGPTVEAGQYDFVSKVGMQDPGARGGIDRWVEQYWTAADGETWGDTNRAPAGEFCIHRFPPPADSAELEDPGTGFLATLPTAPEALAAYFQSHVEGSTSRDEAVFVAVSDILRTGRAIPALRAELFRVLEDTGHVYVTEDARDSRGRAEVRVDFIDEQQRHGEIQSLYFDPDTARVMDEVLSANGHTAFSSVTTRSAVVAKVPQLLLDCARNPHNHGAPGLPIQ